MDVLALTPLPLLPPLFAPPHRFNEAGQEAPPDDQRQVADLLLEQVRGGGGRRDMSSYMHAWVGVD